MTITTKKWVDEGFGNTIYTALYRLPLDTEDDVIDNYLAEENYDSSHLESDFDFMVNPKYINERFMSWKDFEIGEGWSRSLHNSENL